jgi:hypothetical protein
MAWGNRKTYFYCKSPETLSSLYLPKGVESPNFIGWSTSLLSGICNDPFFILGVEKMTICFWTFTKLQRSVVIIDMVITCGDLELLCIHTQCNRCIVRFYIHGLRCAYLVHETMQGRERGLCPNHACRRSKWNPCGLYAHILRAIILALLFHGFAHHIAKMKDHASVVPESVNGTMNGRELQMSIQFLIVHQCYGNNRALGH